MRTIRTWFHASRPLRRQVRHTLAAALVLCGVALVTNPNTKIIGILTVFLNGSGGIESVINGAGAAVNSSFGAPSDVVTYG